MTLINYSEPINYKLLEQYRELLGKDGVAHSLTTLETLIPDYMAELETLNGTQQEPELRRQAHKVKGACRSLGFVRLGEAMHFLERDSWTWPQVDAVLHQSELWLTDDLEEVKRWLKESN